MEFPPAVPLVLAMVGGAVPLKSDGGLVGDAMPCASWFSGSVWLFRFLVRACCTCCFHPFILASTYVDLFAGVTQEEHAAKAETGGGGTVLLSTLIPECLANAAS